MKTDDWQWIPPVVAVHAGPGMDCHQVHNGDISVNGLEQHLSDFAKHEPVAREQIAAVVADDRDVS